jgi:hypothetical protein
MEGLKKNLIKRKEQCVRNQLPLKSKVYGGRCIYLSWNKVVILDFEIKFFVIVLLHLDLKEVF